MKLLHFLTHPVLVIALFYLVLVSGEHFGGPYMLYVLLALPHGGLHAVLALTGTGILLLSYAKYNRLSKYLVDPMLNGLGVGCLFFSLYFFFVRSKGYNSGTFEQVVPMISLVLFGVIAIGFLLNSIIRYAKHKPDMKQVIC